MDKTYTFFHIIQLDIETWLENIDYIWVTSSEAPKRDVNVG